MEVYRASIENEVCQPAFATEKGSSWAKHEVGCELTSVARECSRQMSVLRGSVALWGCSRQANWVFNKLWQPQLGELPWENLPLSVVWDFTVDYCNFLTFKLTILIYSHISEMDSWLNFKLPRPKVSQNWTKMAKNGQKHSCTHTLITRCKKVSSFFVCSNSSVG